jgi:hypothetical protein
MVVPASSYNLFAAKWKHGIALLAVLLLALGVRVWHLGQNGYTVDEMWAVEIATGRGSLHLHMPLNQLTAAPDLYRLADAPPWWRVWTHMEVTHPPLHSILLRLWLDLFGDSDVSGRSLSVLLSLVSLLVFYDVVRLLNGSAVAIWAVLLIALANPQVDYARMTRNYAMLVAAALFMADAVVRIEKRKLTLRRWIGLCLSVLATLLTHYFCLGTILGMMAYSAVRFRGAVRRRMLLSFVVAGLLFAILWGPFMWRQSNLFSVTDQSTAFLSMDQPHHLLKTVQRVLLEPASLLFVPQASSRTIAMGAAVLYVLPFALARRRPDLLLWGFWLTGTVAVVAVLDLTRGTAHLFYSRYTLLAGPAIYALLPALFVPLKSARWLGHLIPVTAAIGCFCALPDVYDPDVFGKGMSNPSELVHDFAHPLRPADLLVFAGTPGDHVSPEMLYLFVDRYMAPVPCPVAVLTEPADAAVVNRVQQSDAAYLFAADPRLVNIVPDSHPSQGRRYLGFGVRWRLE